MRTRIATACVLVGLLLPLHAAAQSPTPSPLADQYVADAYAERSPAWWDTLSRQLVVALDRPMLRIDQKALQNVIFFATNHPDKVELEGATQSLLWIYRAHPEDSHRLMALAALHAIGDREAMYRVYQLVERETSERVRRITAAALYDHYQDQ